MTVATIQKIQMGDTTHIQVKSNTPISLNTVSISDNITVNPKSIL